MGQLLVRKLDDELVAKIKKRAAEHGISVEEEHRRILKESLERDDEVSIPSFKELLMQMPDFDDDSLFERDRTTPDRATPIDWLKEFGIEEEAAPKL